MKKPCTENTASAFTAETRVLQSSTLLLCCPDPEMGKVSSFIQPGKEKALGTPNCNLPVLRGGYKKNRTFLQGLLQ